MFDASFPNESASSQTTSNVGRRSTAGGSWKANRGGVRTSDLDRHSSHSPRKATTAMKFPASPTKPNNNSTSRSSSLSTSIHSHQTTTTVSSHSSSATTTSTSSSNNSREFSSPQRRQVKSSVRKMGDQELLDMLDAASVDLKTSNFMTEAKTTSAWPKADTQKTGNTKNLISFFDNKAKNNPQRQPDDTKSFDFSEVEWELASKTKSAAIKTKKFDELGSASEHVRKSQWKESFGTPPTKTNKTIDVAQRLRHRSLGEHRCNSEPQLNAEAIRLSGAPSLLSSIDDSGFPTINNKHAVDLTESGHEEEEDLFAHTFSSPAKEGTQPATLSKNLSTVFPPFTATGKSVSSPASGSPSVTSTPEQGKKTYLSMRPHTSSPVKKRAVNVRAKQLDALGLITEQHDDEDEDDDDDEENMGFLSGPWLSNRQGDEDGEDDDDTDSEDEEEENVSRSKEHQDRGRRSDTVSKRRSRRSRSRAKTSSSTKDPDRHHRQRSSSRSRSRVKKSHSDDGTGRKLLPQTEQSRRSRKACSLSRERKSSSSASRSSSRRRKEGRERSRSRTNSDRRRSSKSDNSEREEDPLFTNRSSHKRTSGGKESLDSLMDSNKAEKERSLSRTPSAMSDIFREVGISKDQIEKLQQKGLVIANSKQ